MSLHHLLQIADPGAEECVDASGQQDQLSQEQLAAVNDMLKYHMEQEREWQRKRWKKTCWFGALLLLLTVWFFRSQDKALQQRIRNVEDELLWQSNLVERQIGEIEQTIRTGLEAQNSLVAEYHYQVISINPVQQTCTIDVSVIPRRYVEGMTVSFAFSGEEFRPVGAEGKLDENQAFQARAALPLVEDLTISLVLDDGTQQQNQLLDYISGLRSSSQLQIQGDWSGSMRFAPSLGLIVEPAGFEVKGNMDVTFQNMGRYSDVLPQQNYPVEAAVEVWLNGKLAQTMPLDLTSPRESITNVDLRPGEALPPEVWAAYETLTFPCPVEVLLPDVKERANATIEMRISATDVYGVNYNQLYQRLHLYEDGGSDIDHIMDETEVSYPQTEQ